MKVLALAAVMALSLISQSQPPTPTPSKSSQKEQYHGADKSAKDYGPQPTNSTSPVFIYNESNNHKPSGGNESSPDWWITCLTAALVLLAAAQFWAMHRQAEYMRRGVRISIKQSRIALIGARAAKQAADAAASSAKTAWESLKIAECADVVFAGIINTEGNRITPASRFSVSVKNFGRTRAESVQVEVAFDIASKDPNLAHPNLSIDKWGPIDIASADAKIFESLQCVDWIPEPLFALIETGEIGFTYSVSLSFKDIFGASYMRNYYGCFVPSQGFRQSADPF